MQYVNRALLQYLLLTVSLNWLILYHLKFVGLLTLAILPLVLFIPLYFKKSYKQTLKARYFDKDVFVEDLLRALEKGSFYPCSSFENRLFFKSSSVFLSSEPVIDVHFIDNQECVIKYPSSAADLLTKNLSSYIKLREKEFLKETDRLMKEEEQP